MSWPPGMTEATLRRVLEEYATTLGALMCYEPAGDEQQRATEKCVDVLAILVEMVERTDAPGVREKFHRYLGFMEGVLWGAGMMTEGQLRRLNARQAGEDEE